jgi:hypothetical protein
MKEFMCQVKVEAYCFVPINPDNACKFFAVTRGFFGMRTPHCTLYSEVLNSATSPWCGVILPCKKCEDARHLEEVGEQPTTQQGSPLSKPNSGHC